MQQNTYRQKVEQLGRHMYDKDSKLFQQGAWKNLSRAEYDNNRTALRNIASRAFAC